MPNDQPDTVTRLRAVITQALTNPQAAADAALLLDELQTRVGEGAAASDAAHKLTIERAFFERAAREQVIAPQDALAIVGPLNVTLDKAGRVEGLDPIFAELRAKRPWLFRQSATPGLAQHSADASLPAQDPLFEKARGSGLTHDIQLWRESRRR